MRRQAALRLVLDEMFSPVIARQLRERGWDVIAVADDPQLRAMPDPEVFARALTQGRRLVTENVRDFRPLVVDNPTGPGVIFTSSRAFPRSKAGLGALTGVLDAWLEVATSATPTEVWLQGEKQSP